MSNKTTLQTNNSKLNANNTDLASILNTINNLPEAGNSSGVSFPNGTGWTQSNITDKSFYAINYANGIWVAGTDGYGLYYSTDGKIWTQSSLTEGEFYNNSIQNAEGLWIAAGSCSGVYYSTDGINWTLSNLTTDDNEAYCSNLYYKNGIWLVEVYIDNGFSASGSLYYSADGMVWTETNLSYNQANIGYLSCEKGMWIAAVYRGAGGEDADYLYYSTNGINWVLSESFKDTFSLGNICYGKDKWVRRRSRDYENTLYSYCDYSTDGINWYTSFTRTNIKNSDGYKIMGSLYYGNGMWIAFSEDLKIHYSTDGINWTSQSINLYLSDVIYINGIWLGIYFNETTLVRSLYYSLDALNWTVAGAILESHSKYYFNNKIYLLYYDKLIYYSIDGKNWVDISSIFGDSYTINDIICNNGIWVAALGGAQGLYYSIAWEPSN